MSKSMNWHSALSLLFQPESATARLYSALGYVTPNGKLLGNDPAIFAERDRKLTEARERRKQMR